jgi:hypothetical protein
MSRRLFLSFLLLAILLMSSVITVRAAAPALKGTITSSQGTGTITFTAVKAVRGLGYQGNFVIYGKSSPGMVYGVRGTTGIGVVWYYGVSGIMAGNGILTPTGAPNTYSGTVQFFDRAGNVTGTGTVTATYQ